MFGNAMRRRENVGPQLRERDARDALDLRAPLGRYPSGFPVAYNRLVKAEGRRQLADAPGAFDGNF